MPTLDAQLQLSRCPHCNVDQPNLPRLWHYKTTNHKDEHPRFWAAYECKRCGGLVLCSSPQQNGPVREQYPAGEKIDNEAIPKRALSYLDQAMSSIHAPAGAVMLAASSIDAMLKAKGYKDGSLYSRIDKAATDHLITEDMAKWAHDVRLDANDQRHVDEKADLPTDADARRVVEFAKSLALFLFVLPAMVSRGIKDATGNATATKH
jgi:hypothetical protein